MAASATFALKAAVWFRRGRRDMVSPDSRATACPPSGRNSTYRPVQISGTSSMLDCDVTPLVAPAGQHGLTVKHAFTFQTRDRYPIRLSVQIVQILSFRECHSLPVRLDC